MRYVFVDAMGNLIQPDSVTTGFPQLLKENGLRRIRFHDLRHPYVKPTTKKFITFFEVFRAASYIKNDHVPYIRVKAFKCHDVMPLQFFCT